jgi:glutathione-regulated potassium-efflux system ancillary protein KefG
LNGKTLTAAVTAGAGAETYSPDGLNVFTLDELLIPFRMTAKATNMNWVKPWAVFGTPMLSPEGIENAAAEYAEFLTALKG